MPRTASSRQQRQGKPPYETTRVPVPPDKLNAFAAMVKAASHCEGMTPWEQCFVASMIRACASYGGDPALSPREWQILERIADKAKRRR